MREGGLLCYINTIVRVATKLWHQLINHVHIVVRNIFEARMVCGCFV